MAESDLPSRLLTLEVKFNGIEHTTGDIWNSISNLEKILTSIEIQNATILAKIGRIDQVEVDLYSIRHAVHTSEGERRSILGLASLFLLPFGGFLFWALEYLLTGKKP